MKRLTVAVAILLAGVIASHAANITSFAGKPEVFKSVNGRTHPAVKGMMLSASDTITCDKNSRAEIRLDGGHRIKIWPGSKVSLEKISGGETNITLIMGRVRSWVKKLRAKEKFQVKTPVAVCSVRGTDFSVEVGEGDKVRVEVYEGKVAAAEEQTGSEVMVKAGEYTAIEANKPPEEPKSLDEKKPGEEARVQTSDQAAREESRREIFQEISREEVLARAANEIKLAEYQNGKALIDASGNRVRLEEYIVRTQPREFKYVVLNTREDRFDFGKILFTFNDTLPGDLTLATRTMFESKSAVKPQWWLTDVLSVMSNSVDQVNEEASGGDMYADNAARPSKWTHGFQNYTFSVNNKTWWKFVDSNGNGTPQAGELFYYDLNGNALSSYASTFSMPSGETAFHFYQTNTYGADQWITAEDYIIDDNGRIVSLGSLQNLSASQLNKQAYESNFERVYTASVFGGRKIDLVFSAKLLTDAGMLNLPNPKNAQ